MKEDTLVKDAIEYLYQPFNDNFDTFLDKLNKIKSKIDTTKYKKVTIDYDVDDTFGTISGITIVGHRKETIKEKKERLQWEEERRNNREIVERKEYERLKKKYETI